MAYEHLMFDGTTEAKGRNGWFKLVEGYVTALTVDYPTIDWVVMELFSKTHGESAPVQLRFKGPDDMLRLARSLEEMAKRFAPTLPDKHYSVLLLYPDSVGQYGEETYFTHVLAVDAAAAVTKARAEAAKANQLPGDEAEDALSPDDFTVLFVTDGHHPNYASQNEVSDAPAH